MNTRVRLMGKCAICGRSFRIACLKTRRAKSAGESWLPTPMTGPVLIGRSRSGTAAPPGDCHDRDAASSPPGSRSIIASSPASSPFARSIPYALVALGLRLVMARLFFLSGQAKIEGPRIPIRSASATSSSPSILPAADQGRDVPAVRNPICRPADCRRPSPPISSPMPNSCCRSVWCWASPPALPRWRCWR